MSKTDVFRKRSKRKMKSGGGEDGVVVNAEDFRGCKHVMLHKTSLVMTPRHSGIQT